MTRESRDTDVVRKARSTAPRIRDILGPLLVLWVVTLATQLGALFYRLLGAAEQQGSLSSVFLVSAGFLSLLTVPPAAFGLWLSRRMGALGAPVLEGLLRRRPGTWQQLGSGTVLAVLLGLGLGFVMLLLRVVLQPYLPPSTPMLGELGVVGGLLASIGAAVGEEVWARLGVMTVLAWLLMRMRGKEELTPAIAWSANLVAALAFGLMHVPSLVQNDATSLLAVSGTIAGNGVVGTAYGWLYWRRGLLAAMVGHFSVDVVLHVLTAIEL